MFICIWNTDEIFFRHIYKTYLWNTYETLAFWVVRCWDPRSKVTLFCMWRKLFGFLSSKTMTKQSRWWKKRGFADMNLTELVTGNGHIHFFQGSETWILAACWILFLLNLLVLRFVPELESTLDQYFPDFFQWFWRKCSLLCGWIFLEYFNCQGIWYSDMHGISVHDIVTSFWWSVRVQFGLISVCYHATFVWSMLLWCSKREEYREMSSVKGVGFHWDESGDEKTWCPCDLAPDVWASMDVL